MAAGGSAAAATGATASPRRLPWHHAGRCFGGEPAHWWVNTVVDHFADMVPCSCRVLDLIKQHSRGWRRDRLKPFPELRFTYEEGALQLHPSMHACMLGLPACTACMHACKCLHGRPACVKEAIWAQRSLRAVQGSPMRRLHAQSASLPRMPCGSGGPSPNPAIAAAGA